MAPTIHASKILNKEELCLIEQRPRPCAIVIFGASGDLTHRKLLPSLHYLETNKLMPPSFYVLGVARTPMTDEEFRKKVRGSLEEANDKVDIEAFLARCHYQSGEYGSADLY